MKHNPKTFEEVDKHVQSIDPASLQLPAGASAPTLTDLCPVWQKARPVVAFLVGMPFLPAKWKQVADLFLQGMDAICP